MGLSMDYTLPNGIEVKNAFWRIEEVITKNEKKNENYHRILVRAYVSKQWYEANGTSFAQLWVNKTYDPADTASFPLLYAFVKSTDNFATATDYVEEEPVEGAQVEV